MTRLPAAGGDRAQLVLLAAAVAALALVPLVGAYLQLGYAPNAGAPVERPAAALSDVNRSLSAAVRTAVRPSSRPPAWANRSRVAASVRAEVTRTAARIEARSDGVVREVTVDAAAAARWSDCPDGPGRRFGPCEAHDGVVVQQRLGETYVVTVPVTVRAVGPWGTVSGTVWVRQWPDTGSASGT